jgi:hypothetical protein
MGMVTACLILDAINMQSAATNCRNLFGMSQIHKNLSNIFTANGNT